jgi:hypothetical protein
MNKFKGNATILKPEVLLRFMLYSNEHQQQSIQLAPDAWVDFDTAFGPDFQTGTQHKVTLLNAERKAIPYQVVVADTPILHQIPHPDNNGRMIPLAMLYLAPADC